MFALVFFLLSLFLAYNLIERVVSNAWMRGSEPSLVLSHAQKRKFSVDRYLLCRHTRTRQQCTVIYLVLHEVF